MKELPNMKQFRYTFPIIYYKNKIYAIGGRVYGPDNTSLLNTCEVYDYETGEWTDIAPMNKNRCTCSLFIYRGYIYVIGGYTGEYQRSRKVTINCRLKGIILKKTLGSFLIGNYMLGLKMETLSQARTQMKLQ
jgi:hypothetical protein